MLEHLCHDLYLLIVQLLDPPSRLSVACVSMQLRGQVIGVLVEIN